MATDPEKLRINPGEIGGWPILRIEYATDPTRMTTVAVHGGKTLKRGTVRNIIKQSGLTVDEFIALL